MKAPTARNARRRIRVWLVRSAAVAVCASALIGAGAGAPATAGPSGISGAGVSMLAVHNLDAAVPMRAHLELQSQFPGAAPIELTLLPTRAGTGLAFRPSDLEDVPAGPYAARLRADRPFSSAARTLWPSSGGAASYPATAGATRWSMPHFALRTGDNQAAIISLQSLDPSSDTTVVLEVFHPDGRLEATMPIVIEAGRSVSIDTSSDFGFLVVGSFEGWLRFSADRPVVANAIVDVADSATGVYGYALTPDGATSTDLTAPLVLSGAPLPIGGSGSGGTTGDTETWLALANPNDGVAEVSIEAFGLPCETEWTAPEPVALEIPAFGAARLDGDEIVSGSGSGSRAGGCGASVAITSTQPLAGTIVLNETRSGRWGAHALAAGTDAEAGATANTIYLPSVTRPAASSHAASTARPDRIALADETRRLGLPILVAGMESPPEDLLLAPGSVSALVVHNPSTSPVALEIELYDVVVSAPVAECAGCALILEPRASAVLRLDELGLPASVFTGAIASDGPVSAVVLTGDDGGLFDITLDAGRPPAQLSGGTAPMGRMGVPILLVDP